MNKIIMKMKSDQRLREISRQARNKEITEGKKGNKEKRLEINNKRRMIETRQVTNNQYK
jgi:hypothetical protein